MRRTGKSVRPSRVNRVSGRKERSMGVRFYGARIARTEGDGQQDSQKQNGALLGDAALGDPQIRGRHWAPFAFFSGLFATALAIAYILLPEASATPQPVHPIEKVTLGVDKPGIPSFLGFFQFDGIPHTRASAAYLKKSQNLTYAILGFHLAKNQRLHWEVLIGGVTKKVKLSLGKNVPGSGSRVHASFSKSHSGETAETSTDIVSGVTTEESRHAYVIQGTAIGPMDTYLQDMPTGAGVDESKVIVLPLIWNGPGIVAVRGRYASVYGPALQTGKIAGDAVDTYGGSPFRAQELIARGPHSYRIDMGATEPSMPGAFVWDNHASGALTATAASGIAPDVEQTDIDDTFWAGVALAAGAAFLVAALQAVPEGSLSQAQQWIARRFKRMKDS